MKLLTASKKFSVPSTTLRDHLKNPGLKDTQLFSKSEEMQIVAALQALKNWPCALASVVMHEYLANQAD